MSDSYPLPALVCPNGQTLDSTVFVTDYYCSALKTFDSLTGQYTRAYGKQVQISKQDQYHSFSLGVTPNNFLLGSPSYFATQFGNSTRSVIFDAQFCQVYLFDKLDLTIKLIAGDISKAQPILLRPDLLNNNQLHAPNDGMGTTASFAFVKDYTVGIPCAVSQDISTALVYDTGLIRSINVNTGEVRTLAGRFNVEGYFSEFYVDKPSYGAGTDAVLGFIPSLSLSKDGKFALLADILNSRIHHINTITGVVSFVVGHPLGRWSSVDGQGENAWLFYPISIAIFNNDRTAIFGECGNYQEVGYHYAGIRLLDIATSTTTKIGGHHSRFGFQDNGNGRYAYLTCPTELTVSSDESYALFIDHMPIFAIRKIDLKSIYHPITTIRAMNWLTIPISLSNIIYPACSACSPGKYLEAGSSLTQCTKCAVGTFTTQTGSTGCDLCPAGYFSNTQGVSACQLCRAGSFSDVNGSSGCRGCADGSFSPFTGLTNCIQCAPGSYSTTTGLSVCTQCSAGTYNTAMGAQYPVELHSTSLSLCSSGVYQFHSMFNGMPKYKCTIELNYVYCSYTWYLDVTQAYFQNGAWVGVLADISNSGAGCVFQKLLESRLPVSEVRYCSSCKPDTYMLTTGATVCLSCLSAPLCSNGQFRVGCSGNSLGNCSTCFNTQ
jgi:hypothetical protein